MDIPEYPFPASSSGLTSLRPYPPVTPAPQPPQRFFSTRHHHPGHPKFPETSLTCPWIDCSVNKFENHFFPLPLPSCPKLPLATTTNKWIFLGVAVNRPELFLVKICTCWEIYELQMHMIFLVSKIPYIYIILFLKWFFLGGLWGV
jgi:hypothetical protein